MTLVADRVVVGYSPAAVPELDLVDTERWRELGVTHWHLIAEEVATADKQGFRFSRDRWNGLSNARYVGEASDPRDAWRWICERRIAALEATSDPAKFAARAGLGSEAAWVQRCSVSWWMLTQAVGCAGGGLSISDGRSMDIFADPKTAADCTKH